MLEIAVGGTPGVIKLSAVAFIGAGEINAGTVLRFVLVKDSVALIVAGLAD